MLVDIDAYLSAALTASGRKQTFEIPLRLRNMGGSEHSVDLRGYGHSGALSLDLPWTYMGSSTEFLILKLVLSN